MAWLSRFYFEHTPAGGRLTFSGSTNRRTDFGLDGVEVFPEDLTSPANRHVAYVLVRHF